MAKVKKKITLDDLDRSIKNLATTVDNLAQNTQHSIDDLAHTTTNLIDGLALATHKGFEDVTKRLDKHDAQFEVVINRLDNIEADVRDSKLTLGSVVQMSADSDKEMAGVKTRLVRVERKVT